MKKLAKNIFAVVLSLVIIATMFAMAACGVSQEEVDKLNQQIEELNTKLAAAEKEAKDTKALLDKANADKAAAEKLAEQYKDKPLGIDNVDYELSDDGTHYIATGLKEGSDGTSVVLASEFNGLPVTEISEEAFAWQNQDGVDKGEAISVIRNVFIPKSITVIGKKAFAGLTQLSGVVMEGPFDTDESGIEIFMECGMSYFRVPEGQKVLPAGFLRACTKLVTVELGTTLEEIGDGAFFSCTAIREIMFPDSLKRIDDNAFWAAFYFTNGNVPANLEYLGKEAFYYCVKLKGEWNFGANFKFLGSNAFYLCREVTSVTFAVTDGWFRTTDAEATEGDAVTMEGNQLQMLMHPSSEQKEGEPTRLGEYYYKHN